MGAVLMRVPFAGFWLPSSPSWSPSLKVFFVCSLDAVKFVVGLLFLFVRFLGYRLGSQCGEVQYDATCCYAGKGGTTLSTLFILSVWNLQLDFAWMSIPLPTLYNITTAGLRRSRLWCHDLTLCFTLSAGCLDVHPGSCFATF